MNFHKLGLLMAYFRESRYNYKSLKVDKTAKINSYHKQESGYGVWYNPNNNFIPEIDLSNYDTYMYYSNFQEPINPRPFDKTMEQFRKLYE